MHRRRHPALPADAVLLGGRIRQRRRLGADRRRHAGDRADPRPETTLTLLERQRVRSSAVGPSRRKHWRGRGGGQADLSALQPGSLEALLPPEQRAEPGDRARLFGMTESFSPYSGYPADIDMPRPQWGSCGRPFDGMTVRIADPSTGAAVPDGVTGVIQLRGPHTMRGMCGRSREELFTPDGYYPTGDLGHLDDAGFLFYHGRDDDMFKVSGATVYPSEIERVLRAVDGVRDAVVTNVLDDRVGAAVVCDPATITVAQLTAAVRKSLSAFKSTDRVGVTGLRRRDTAPGVGQGRHPPPAGTLLAEQT